MLGRRRSEMDNGAPQDFIDSEKYSVEELRQMVLEGRGVLSRPLALSLLRHKEYPQKVEDLEALLMDEGEAPRIRNLAAQILGETKSPQAVGALERGIRVQDDVALRGVVRALTVAGRIEAIPALRSLAERGGPVGEAAARAITLLTHQLGTEVSGHGQTGTAKANEEGNEDSSPIHVEALPEGDLEEAVETLSPIFPALRLAKEGSVALRRGDRAFLFLPNRDVVEDLSSLDRDIAQLGVVAVRRGLEGAGWEAKYHILAEPDTKGRCHLAVVAANGKPLFSGSGVVQDRSVAFDVEAVERPGSIPARVRGTYDGREVRLEEARVGTRSPTPAPAPRERSKL
jgi:hypothetical protein